MNVYVYTISGITPNECVGIIDNYASFNFTKSFRGCGTWTLKGNFTDEVEDMLKVGNFIFVTPQICGLIQSVEYDTDEKGNVTYVAYGNEIKGVLGFRIVWDTYSRTVNLRDYVNDMVERNTQGVRQLFGRIDKPQISTSTIDKQISYSNLLEAIEDVLETAESTDGNPIGFDVVCEDGKRFVFTLLEGEDRTITSAEPVVISRDLDNVSNLTYVDSDKELVNIVKAGGEGEGAERKFVTVGSSHLTGFARREAFADCRNLQSTYEDENGDEQTLTAEEYTALLTAEAKNSLNPVEFTVDAESVVDVKTALEYLGSRVTLQDRALNVQADDYISEVNIIDENDGMLVTLTVGEGVKAKRIVVE